MQTKKEIRNNAWRQVNRISQKARSRNKDLADLYFSLRFEMYNNNYEAMDTISRDIDRFYCKKVRI